MKCCLTTNPQPQNDRLAALLREQGLEVLQLPLHRYATPLAGLEGLAPAIVGLTVESWVVVCSAQSVRVLDEQGLLATLQAQSCRIAAVGNATAAALTNSGCEVALTGAAGAEALARDLVERIDESTAVVSLQAEDGMKHWHPIVRAHGGSLTIVPTHRLERIAGVQMPREGHFDAVCFTAPSAVAAFADNAELSRRARATNAKFFPIGLSTATALRAHRLSAEPTPERPGMQELAQQVAALLQ